MKRLLISLIKLSILGSVLTISPDRAEAQRSTLCKLDYRCRSGLGKKTLLVFIAVFLREKVLFLPSNHYS